MAKILHLCKLKNYKQETMHLAINVFDRCLSCPYLGGITNESLPLLYVVCVIIAAKIEQPLSPSINLTLKILDDKEKAKINKEKIIEFEAKVLLALDYELSYDSPLTYLERFLRLLNV